MCLRNVLGDFSANNLKKIELNELSVYGVSVDYDVIDTSNIIDIPKYLMKKHDIK